VTTLSIIDSTLTIEVQGWDKLWSLTSRLEIPLEHVMDVRRADDEVEGIRMPGTHVPGVITAGTFVHDGDSVFWDVHDPAKAIALDLRDERYSKLVIEVADPTATIEAVKQALLVR
jgi:Bacterial PH domain